MRQILHTQSSMGTQSVNSLTVCFTFLMKYPWKVTSWEAQCNGEGTVFAILCTSWMTASVYGRFFLSCTRTWRPPTTLLNSSWTWSVRWKTQKSLIIIVMLWMRVQAWSREYQHCAKPWCVNNKQINKSINISWNISHKLSLWVSHLVFLGTWPWAVSHM